VQLVGGEALWPKVRNFVLPSLLESVRAQAAARTRNGLYAGALVSLLAGGLVWLALGGSGAGGDAVVADADVPAASAAVSAPEPAQAPRPDAAMLQQISATAKAMEEVAKLTPEQLAHRRVEAAKRVSALPRVQQAAWSAQRTLLVTLSQSSDEQTDNQLLEETCRLLVQQEELRFTRVQLETSNAGGRVRWRLCE
jgi:hypothetical protein